MITKQQRIWPRTLERLQKISIDISSIEGKMVRPTEIIDRMTNSDIVEDMLKRGAEVRRRQNGRYK